MALTRILAVLFVFLWVPLVSAQPVMVPGEIIVRLKSQGGSQETFAFFGKAHSQKEMTLKASYGKMNLYHFNLKAGQDVSQTIQDLQQDPNVLYAEPNYIFSKDQTEVNQIQSVSASDVELLASGGYNPATNSPIQALEARSALSASSNKPIVAIVDTGLDVGHPVFTDSNALWTNPGEIPGNGIDDDDNGYVDDVHGYNFVNNTGNMIDDDGHGTHVAGIVVGVGTDIFNAPYEESKIQVMPLKFLGADGSGTTSAAIKAIYYAVNNGANVINNSWGGGYYSGALHEALTYAYENGVSIVAAAGNNGSNNDSIPMYPANYDIPSLISIAATTNVSSIAAEELADFSNFGNVVDVGAPGQSILSTIPGGGYGYSSGTSMATPFAAGIAALMLIESPNMLGYQVKSGIETNGDFTSKLSKVHTSSRVNALNSVNYAKGAVVSASQPAYSFMNQDRDLASSLAAGGAGGCGTVTKLYSQFNKGQGRGPAGPQTWYILFVVGLMLMPMMVWTAIRQSSPECKRQFERFNINTEVKMSFGGKEMVGNISTISLGGAQLNTDAMLEDGGIINMTISSPTGEDQVSVEGRVVWSASKKAYGIQFANTKATALAQIGSWTKSLTRA